MKLFFFDIDGTLISCTDGINEIPDSTKKSLNQLKKEGHKVYLATGRCPCFLLDGVTNYKFDGLVSCNGALVIDNNAVVYKSIISKEAMHAVKDFADKHKSLIYFESKDYIYASNTNHPVHKLFIDQWGMREECLIYDYDINQIESYIGMIVLNDESEVSLMQKALSDYFIIQRHQHGLSFDLTIKGESKAKGIKEFVKLTHNKLENTIAFGDGRNDVEMLETVNLSIAMGNAAPAAKRVADYITKSVTEDGITHALKILNFIN